MAGPVGCGLCGLESLSEALRPLPVIENGLRVSAAEIAAVAADGPEPAELQQALARFASSLYRENDSITSRIRSA